MESRRHQFHAACHPSSHTGRRQSRRLTPFPFPQQMQECFDVQSPHPRVPSTRINHQSDPFHHLQINLSSGGVPAFPSCKIRVKNSCSPCTCPFEAKTVFYFYSPDFLMVGSSQRRARNRKIARLSGAKKVGSVALYAWVGRNASHPKLSFL